MSTSTRVRDQGPLTTSTGRIWLVVGGLFALVALGLLVPMTALPPPGVALVAAVLVVLLYAAMVVVRIAVPRGRRRLAALAWLTLAMGVVATVGVCTVAVAVSPRIA